MSASLRLDTKEWFIETSFPGVRRCKLDGFRIDKEIFKAKTKYQSIHVFESAGFGKMLSLDGIIQLSESDEFIYHEIIAHLPLLSHPDPKRILIVGGGDGGVLREAAKHPLKELYQVEIDREVVAIARKHLAFISQGAFSDKRLKLFFEDGNTRIRQYKNFFDVIVVDSTDPVGPGKVLFEGNFYKNVCEALTGDGIAIFQLGPFLDFDLIVKPTARKLKPFFKYLNPVRLSMPSYSCGCEYCFMTASKRIDPAALTPAVIAKRLAVRLGSKAQKLKYYTPAIHHSALVMPKIWQLAK